MVQRERERERETVWASHVDANYNEGTHNLWVSSSAQGQTVLPRHVPDVSVGSRSVYAAILLNACLSHTQVEIKDAVATLTQRPQR